MRRTIYEDFNKSERFHPDEIRKTLQSYKDFVFRWTAVNHHIRDPNGTIIGELQQGSYLYKPTQTVLECRRNTLTNYVLLRLSKDIPRPTQEDKQSLNLVGHLVKDALEIK